MAPTLVSSIAGKKSKAGMALFSFLIILALVLAACGNGSGSTGSTSTKHILTIGAHVGGDFTKALSPYNPTLVNEGIQGMVYETLLFFNRNDGSVTKLLATDYKWSADQKQLTFTTRDNVKWSDGKPFSAADVAFTFNMLKQYPTADSKGLWTYLSSVSAPDANTVVLNFKTPNPPLLWYIGGQTFIVPQHIFQNVDPTKFDNSNPVGTGPFKFARFSPQLLTYTKNPTYWQADKIQIDELQYPAVKDNQTLQLKLMKGEIDWGSFFAPDLDKTYVQKDTAHNHYWMAPTDIFTLYVNLTKAPFNDVNVRQAISAAIDRSQLSKQAESGYVAPASTTGLILPNAKDYLDPNYQNVQSAADISKADQYLQAAGYTKGSDGIYAKAGKKLSFSIKVVNGWTDWETMASVIKQNLKDAGIDASVDDIQDTAYFDARNNGNFDALIGGLFGGPTPFYLYDTHLNSVNLSPKGFNWGKWNDSATDKLLQAYSSTVDPAKQKQAIMGLEKIYADKLPNIPLVNAASWYEYSTKHFTGWPNQDNPYAVGAAYSTPDNLMVVLNLKPVA
ncbi:ABC transporter substrate-binding protein [Dictyobacter kobayashii]|uniref:Peptide ABC transporter substrate-binding protein n=1 Tax=Dictyobacter kobayashii TaxID=2014872 RepID=A0A402AJN0_9CHLR|nr:ABC transporter substrate-binding protein [Dictyobacter kobayashii]GCE19279.1 peptide ABC transporter substrate-binding protein [Dictyobacter kobayashii]